MKSEQRAAQDKYRFSTRLMPASFALSEHEIAVTFESYWRWKSDAVTAKRLSPELLESLDSAQLLWLKKRSMMCGIDPGKKATFTLLFYIFLELLEENDPKMVPRTAMNLKHGRHR